MLGAAAVAGPCPGGGRRRRGRGGVDRLRGAGAEVGQDGEVRRWEEVPERRADLILLSR